jgi:diguanylate cyclase (GGDEF)-like protein/PAS domain S-box-containing protein
MDELKKLLLANEQWLMERVLTYAKRQNFTKYKSTLIGEAWRLSISGLSKAIVEALDLLGDQLPDFAPDEDYTLNPIAAFGISEAKLHRKRGVNLGMFLGLLKYYRQTYQDLIREKVQARASGARYGLFIVRCFDLFELALSAEWNRTPNDEIIEELQRTNRQLANEKIHYSTLFESLSSPVFLINAEAVIENLNMAAIRLLELESDGTSGGAYHDRLNRTSSSGKMKEATVGSSKPILGKPLWKILPWLAEIFQSIDDDRKVFFNREIKTQINKQTKHFDVTISNILDVSGKYEGAVVVLSDITERKAAQESLRISEERLSMALDATSDGLWDWNIKTGETYFSPRYYTMLGYEPNEFEPSIQGWQSLLHPDDIDRVTKTVNEHLEKAQPFEVDFRMRTKSGTWHWILGRGKVVAKTDSGKAKRMVGVHWDITERKQMEEEIRKLASTDSLTGINNRRSFMQLANAEWTRSQRYRHPFSVLMLDIDHFKNINDTYGHHIGDLTLKTFSNTCMDILRENDIFGRVGGEEFAAILVETAEKEALQVAERLRKKISKVTITKDEITFNFQVSIGVANSQNGDQRVDELFMKADQALYRAKRLGRNRVVLASQLA